MRRHTTTQNGIRSLMMIAATTLLLTGCGGGDDEPAPAPRVESTGPGFFDQGGGFCELLALALNGQCDSPPRPQTAACDGYAHDNPASAPACLDNSLARGRYPAAPHVAVSSPTGSTVTLSWMPPTQYNDGSWLGDLAGYSVRWTMFPYANWNTAATIYLDNPGLSSYVMELPRAGIWYLTVSAVNRDGLGGPISNIVSVEIL